MKKDRFVKLFASRAALTASMLVLAAFTMGKADCTASAASNVVADADGTTEQMTEDIAVEEPDCPAPLKASGTSGTINWDLTGTKLTLSGSGTIPISGGWSSSKTTITEIEIKEGIVGIPMNGFTGYSALTKVSIPASVTKILTNAFGSDAKLATVIIAPESQLATLGTSAFKSCSALKSIDLSGATGLTNIPNDAFNGCSALASLKLPPNLTTIGNNAFYSTGITSISIPSTVTSIGTSAFNGCKSLAGTITIPAGVTSMGQYAFMGCSSLQKAVINAPATVPHYAFKNCSALTSVTFGAKVTEIGNQAFYGCGLTSLSIPGNVATIGTYAFQNCTNLKTATFGSGVATIKMNAFDSCGLTSLTIPDSVTSIETCAFINNGALQTVSIGSGVTEIAVRTFSTCPSLTTVNLGANVTAIGGMAFYHNFALSSINLGKIATIGENAFDECTSLTAVAMGDAAKSLEINAFYNCKNLTEFTITATDTAFTTPVFGNVFNLTIYGKNGSTAQSYANANGHNFSLLKVTSLGNTTLKSVIAATSGVNLSWGTVADAEGYKIYRKTGSGAYALLATVTSGKTVSYTDATAKGGNSYTYKVCAYAGSINGSNANEMSITLLGASSISSVTQSAGKVTIKWNAQSGVDGYTLYRKTGSGAYTAIYTAASASTVTYTDDLSSVTNPTTYTYKLEAKKGTQVSTPAESSIRVLGKAKIGAVTYSNGAITVNWTAGSNITGYQVYRKAGSGSWTQIATVSSASTTKYTDSSITVNGTTYSYCVKYYDATGNGISSDAASLTPVGSPTLKTITKNDITDVTITWSSVTSANGYYVYRKSGNGSFTKIATITSGSTLSYKDSSVTTGTLYTYAVSAYNGNLEGAMSGTLQAALFKAPIMTISNSTNGITLKWSKNTGASGYVVHRQIWNEQTGTWGAFSKVTTVSGGTTQTWTDTSVSDKTLYAYKVCAYTGTESSATMGGFSEARACARISVRTITSVTTAGGNKAVVAFNQGASSYSGYQIEVQRVGSVNVVDRTIKVADPKATYAVINGLGRNTSYSIRVRSYVVISGKVFYGTYGDARSVYVN